VIFDSLFGKSKEDRIEVDGISLSKKAEMEMNAAKEVVLSTKRREKRG